MHASAHDPMSSGSGRLLGWRKNASFASSWPQSPREKAAAQLRAEMADVRPFLPEAESPIDWENESSCAAHSLMNMLENKARCAEHRRSVFSTLSSRRRDFTVAESCLSKTIDHKPECSIAGGRALSH